MLVVCLTSLGAAQSRTTGGSKPVEQIQQLTRALSGHWSLSVNWEPDATMPRASVNSGVENWRPGPGGYTLIEEEQVQMHGQQDFLLGVVWWDSASKSLRGMECQNLLPYTCDIKGARSDITMGWDGKQFAINEVETSKSGQKSIWHETWSDITPTSFIQTGEYGPPGGSRKRVFTIHATRVANVDSKETLETIATEAPSAKGPQPEMQSLVKALAGHWSTTYDFDPSGRSPRGTGSGEEIWRPSPGGYVLMEEEHFKSLSGEVFLIALHWWDKSTNSLHGMLCNNAGPATCDLGSDSNSTVKWDGSRLIIDFNFRRNDKNMLWHEVWSGITATSFTQTGDMGEVGGPLKRAVTIHGSKVAGHAQPSAN